MKKKVIIICLVVFLVLLLFVSFIFIKGNMMYDRDLCKILEINWIDNLLEQHKNVSSNVYQYNEEGEVEFSGYNYAGKDILVFEDSNKNIKILTDKEEYGFDAESGNAYRSLFVGENEFENYKKESWHCVFVDVITNSKLLSKEKVDKNYELRYSLDMEKVIEPEEEEILNKAEGIVYKYIIDGESYEVKEWECYAIVSGNEVKYRDVKLSYDQDEYIISEELKNSVFDEGRKLTIIANPGTKDEVVYEQSTSKGNTILVMLSDEFKKLYKDKECTQEKGNEEVDLYSDRTLYVSTGK